MANDNIPRPDYSSAKPMMALIANIGKDERTIIQKGALLAFNHVLDHDPRFNKNPNAMRLKKLLQSKEVLPIIENFILGSTADVEDKDKDKKDKDKKATEETELLAKTAKLGAVAYSTLGVTAHGGATYADNIFELATNLDNPVARRRLIDEAIKKTQELHAQYKADKTPAGAAKIAETEAKLAKEIKAAGTITKDGIALAEHEVGPIAKLTAKAGRLGARLGKLAAVGGPVGALAGLGISSVSAGLVFASSYAVTGDTEQSAKDAVGAVVPVDAVAALAKGDYNTSAAKMAGFYIPGIDSIAHYALKKINPENKPDIFLHAAGRTLAAGAKAAVNKGADLMGLDPRPDNA